MSRPPLDAVRSLQRRLADGGAPSVVGGSGLLAWLGLTDTVRDWDLVTDAQPCAVRTVLDAAGLDYRCAEPGGVYRTAALFTLPQDGYDIDLLVRFALHSPTGTVPIPATAGGTWNGLVMARPQEWALAYRLMGRTAKADLLDEYLRRDR